MRTGSLIAALSLLACSFPCLGQNPPDLPEAQRFTALLKLDPAEDAKLFAATGADRSITLLQIVQTQGIRPDATFDDWKNLHRAMAGLIELLESRGEFMQAAIIATYQESNYRNLERDYRSALGAARQQLRLLERAGDHSALARAHVAVAQDLLRLGRPAEALTEFRAAHDLELDLSTSDAAFGWREIVQVDIALGDLVAAREEAARMAERASSSPILHAYALIAQSDIQIAEQHYDAAVETVVQAQALITDPKEREVIGAEAANQFLDCVMGAVKQVSYDDALRLASRIEKQETIPGFSLVAITRAAVLARRRMNGDLEGALHYDNERLAQARAANNILGQIEALRSIALTYSAMHATSQRIALLEEALSLTRSLLPANKIPIDYPSANSYFFLLDELGEAYTDIGELQKASDCFEDVLSTEGKITSAPLRTRLGSSLSDARLGSALALGLAALPTNHSSLDGDADEARNILKAELKLRPNYSWAFLYLARLERDQDKNPVQAAEFYAAAVKAFGAEGDRRTEVIFGLEYARYLAGDARSRIPDALSLARKQVQSIEAEAVALGFADADWQLLYTRGLIAEGENHLPAAITAYQTAIGKLDRLRAGLTGEEQRQSFLSSDLIRALYAHLVAALTASGRQADAWQYLERGKARAFLEMLGGRKFQASPGEEKTLAPLRQIETQMNDLRAQLAPSSHAGGSRGAVSPVRLQENLRVLQAKFAVLREESDLGSTRAAQPLALTPPSMQKIGSLLPPGTVLIEYAMLNDSMAAFVVGPKGYKLCQWPLKKKEWAEATDIVNKLPHILKTEHAPQLETLSRLIVYPIMSAIPAGTRHLLIVPTAALYYVPFQALQLPDGRAILDAYDVSYLPSAGTLEFLKNDTRAGSLFIGAIGDVSVEGHDPLPGTLLESDAIAKVYPHATRLSGRDFTHDAARDALLHYDAVHFATHGLVDQQAPLFSALLTNPAAGQPSRLSLYEIMSMHLHARLVVLSACKTGLGQLMGGDEIAGLTRTFLSAGASTVVSSLWSVADDSTSLLMAEFHRAMQQGRTPATAMREAMIAVRRQYPEPYYWAPFIVTGAR